MAFTIDPVPAPRSSDTDSAWELIVDRALHAALVNADGDERMRLVKVLRRLEPVAVPSAKAGAPTTGAAIHFEQLLQGLARG